MAPGQPAPLQLPSFLHGIYPAVHQKTHKEGMRCGEQYRKDGSFPAPQQMVEVAPGEVVVVEGVVDFQHARPAWRLYMVSNVRSGLWEALDYPSGYEVDDLFEAFCRETAWGALYFMCSHSAPQSAERMALRLQALLRFWEPLQSVRYLFRTPTDALSLDELMTAACAWAMDAWCPVGDASVRSRLAVAAERMARATREDSIAAILREMPRALSYARGLKHRDVVGDPVLQRQRIDSLTPKAFERVSGACTSEVLGLLYAWDRQLGKQ